MRNVSSESLSADSPLMEFEGGNRWLLSSISEFPDDILLWRRPNPPEVLCDPSMVLCDPSVGLCDPSMVLCDPSVRLCDPSVVLADPSGFLLALPNSYRNFRVCTD
ncbi:hypothetical protein J437_LFUL006943 [Ladona fulva]|uniref:Uncharacterized protein n=1 Tax=Ladona fulva TaxID=123851 RepID=A0A8K0KAA6_LADFU|nr:hypothetical protein J437_LFUL006943 [Ladona fulva]